MNIDKAIAYSQSLFSSFSRFQTYFSEFFIIHNLSRLGGVELRDPKLDKKLRVDIFKEIFKSFKWHAKNVSSGVYVEDDETFPLLNKEHWLTLSKMMLDFPSVIKRRKKNSTTLENQDYPDYFNRNFHFQTDGYTSERSAELYEHQVEVLFNGTANLMRKMVLTSIHHYYDQKEAKVLELASGTGAGARSVALNHPTFDILGTDISREYISYAKKTLKNNFKNLRFEVEDATALSFLDQEFDITFQIFLLHELPRAEREKAIEEQIRVTKKGGLIIILESLQRHDKPEWEPIFQSFPRHYHEPFYNDYSKSNLEEFLKTQGQKTLSVQKQLFSKCITLRKL